MLSKNPTSWFYEANIITRLGMVIALLGWPALVIEELYTGITIPDEQAGLWFIAVAGLITTGYIIQVVQSDTDRTIFNALLFSLMIIVVYVFVAMLLGALVILAGENIIDIWNS